MNKPENETIFLDRLTLEDLTRLYTAVCAEGNRRENTPENEPVTPHIIERPTLDQLANMEVGDRLVSQHIFLDRLTLEDLTSLYTAVCAEGNRRNLA